MLGLIAGLMWVGARIPTYAYFNIPDEYTEIEIKEPIVEECYEYAKNISNQFLVEFSGPHPVVLLHAWKKSTDRGDFYACEVMRLRVRYLLTVNIPVPEEPNAKYLWSVKILNEETASGSHWFEPPDELVDLVMSEVRKQYPDAELLNVAVFKTVMKVHLYGQMVLHVSAGSDRMLLDVSMERQFGSKEEKVTNIRRVY
jgi:hypothetical protein